MAYGRSYRRSYRRPYRRSWKARKYAKETKKRRIGAYKFRDFIGPRGEPKSLNAYGADFKTANPEQRALRRALGFRGKGAYYGDGGYYSDKIKPWLQKTIPSGTFAGLGETFAGPLGKNLGQRLANFTGWGDYSANQIVGGGLDPSQISVNASSLEQDLWVEHTEFIANIYSTATFSQQKYILNAGLSSTFPWLSQIAKLYEMYRFHGLMFQYKPLLSEMPGTPYTGKIIMATAYDPYWQGFSTEQQMENYSYAQADKPVNGLIHGCETDPSQIPQSMLYNRVNNVVESTRPLDMSDLGVFTVATNNANLTAGTILGELWVTYRVCLSRPQQLSVYSENFTALSGNLFCGSKTFWIESSNTASITQKLYDEQTKFKLENLMSLTAGTTQQIVKLYCTDLAAPTTSYWHIQFYMVLSGTESSTTNFPGISNFGTTKAIIDSQRNFVYLQPGNDGIFEETQSSISNTGGTGSPGNTYNTTTGRFSGIETGTNTSASINEIIIIHDTAVKFKPATNTGSCGFSYEPKITHTALNSSNLPTICSCKVHVETISSDEYEQYVILNAHRSTITY